MLSDLLDLRTMFARAFIVFNDCLWTFLSFAQLRLASVSIVINYYIFILLFYKKKEGDVTIFTSFDWLIY